MAFGPESPELGAPGSMLPELQHSQPPLEISSDMLFCDRHVPPDEMAAFEESRLAYYRSFSRCELTPLQAKDPELYENLFKQQEEIDGGALQITTPLIHWKTGQLINRPDRIRLYSRYNFAGHFGVLPEQTAVVQANKESVGVRLSQILYRRRSHNEDH